MLSVPTHVWVTWLFAGWWLVTAIRDYSSPRLPRYRNGLTLAYALIAAGQLAWLGYVLLQQASLLVFLTLVGFGLCWGLWAREARRRS